MTAPQAPEREVEPPPEIKTDWHDTMCGMMSVVVMPMVTIHWIWFSDWRVFATGLVLTAVAFMITAAHRSMTQ